MDESISGRQLAALLGSDLAEELGVTDGEYAPEQVEALTDRLAESTALAEGAATGDEGSLSELFSPGFMTERTAYDSFAAFDADAPWREGDLGALFAPREAGLPSATTRDEADAFVAQNTEFVSTGGMVRAAVVHHVSEVLED